MNEASRIEYVGGEKAGARRGLKAADLLLRAGLPDRAVSQAYYAVFHAVRAALYLLGQEPKTHRGAMRQFAKQYVKTGRVSSDLMKVLGRAREERDLSDYDPLQAITQERASSIVASAHLFVEEIIRHIDAASLEPPDTK